MEAAGTPNAARSRFADRPSPFRCVYPYRRDEINALPNGKWTQDLLTHCVTIGHGKRVRVGMPWIGTTFRLDAREKRLDLQPNAQGILGIFSVDGAITALAPIGLNSDPAGLVKQWLAA